LAGASIHLPTRQHTGDEPEWVDLLRAAYPWLGRIPSPWIVAPGSRRLSGRNALDAATSAAIDSGSATCHHSPPVAIEAHAPPVRSNMIPAYAHSLIGGNPGTRIAIEPSTFQKPSRTMNWTGNPSATTPWTTSGTCMAYASPPDPMKNTLVHASGSVSGSDDGLDGSRIAA